MSTITLGFRPIGLEILLSRDADFVTALVADDPWPDGTAIALLFAASRDAEPIEWAAQIDGVRAAWDVPAAQVRQVLAADAQYVRLCYTEPDGTVLTWGRGMVTDA